MRFHVAFQVSERIFLKDPENSELGKQIVKTGIDLIHTLGYEQFTFKKLAIEIGTTEASIYRYFENKHRLLVYILNWYWNYLEFLVGMQVQLIADPRDKISKIIQLLTHELPDTGGEIQYNKKFLNQIVIAESSKAYLVKDVSEINQEQVFLPFKALCGVIADVIANYNPEYKYPHSLASTMIETAHDQHFFATNLPRLTDRPTDKDIEVYVSEYLEDLIQRVLN
jgi:AcrR family transcriptional regulator